MIPNINIDVAADDVAQIMKLLDEIISANTELFQAGVITPTGGNVSSRLQHRPNEIWITPSQIYKGSLLPEMIVPINLDGNLLNGYAYRASSERFVHCSIMNDDPEVNAVIHSHAPYAEILWLSGLPFAPISVEAAALGDIPNIPFIMPGTKDLGIAVAGAIRGKKAVMMQNHGLVAAGTSVREAADITLMVESTAKKILLSHISSDDPKILSDEIVERIRKNANLVG